MMAATPTLNDPSIKELIKLYPAGQEKPNQAKDQIIKYEDKIRYISPQPMHAKESQSF